MDDTLALVLASTKRFLTDHVDADAIDRNGAFPAGMLARAADVGLFGLGIPTEYDGLGLGLFGTSRILCEVARVDRSLATTLGLHNGLGTRPLIELGSDPLRSAWLPRFASGASVASFCATESEAGSDLSRVRTTATLVRDQVRLLGSKVFVTNGGFADAFTALVRSPGMGGERGTSLVFVPRSTHGVRIGAEEHKLGIRGSSTVSVYFDGASVPAEHVLGEAGQGIEQAYRALVWGRTLMAAGCLGAAQTAFEKSVEHVKHRRQFGQALATRSHVRDRIAEMRALLVGADALIARAALETDGGRDSRIVSAAAKVFASDTACYVADAALQLHGGAGYMTETGVALILRDVRVARIFEGANDVLLLRMALELVMGRDELERLGIRDAGLRHRLEESVERARRRYGVNLVKRQVYLGRLGQILTHLQAARAIELGFGLSESPPDEDTRASCSRFLEQRASNLLPGLSAADEDEELSMNITHDLLGPERSKNAMGERNGAVMS